MSKHGSKLITAAVLVVAAAVPGQGRAQTAANPDFYLKGSDTLFDIMTASIAAAKTKGVLPTASPTLIYDGTGSGNAENQMKVTTGTVAGRLGVQSIGPMSRNFRPATPSAFPTWAPTVQNVLALDAAVVITKNATTRCKNISLPLFATDSTKANQNTAALASTISFGTTGSGYDQLLEVILSGIDGSGSVAACSSPARVQAIADFAACNGVATLNHLYRRDDNSGTTDTFKDKIMRNGAGGRFCNGAAVGSLGGNKVHPNLNNQDNDPVRRPCDVSSASRVQVSCTDMVTGAPCNSSAATCTQGFITALSENDPGLSDITLTIGTRIAADPTGATVGFAGREATRVIAGAAGAFINTNPPSDALTRLDLYLLARRLFLQRGPSNPGLDATTPAAQLINDNGVLASGLTCPDGSANFCAGGGATQLALETTLFNYMTDPGGVASPDGAPGRCNTDPLVKQFGFITCLDDCLATPTGVANLCSKAPYVYPASPPSACVPSGTQSAAGVSTWNGAALYTAFTTTANAPTCCSDGSKLSATGGTCPAANSGRGLNFACSTAGVAAECGLNGTLQMTCTDIGGGTLVCQ